MNSKHVILIVSLMLAGGAAAADISRSAAEQPRPVSAPECSDPVGAAAIPRVVITARRAQAGAADAEIPRVVVIGRRQDAAHTLAATQPSLSSRY